MLILNRHNQELMSINEDSTEVQRKITTVNDRYIMFFFFF